MPGMIGPHDDARPIASSWATFHGSDLSRVRPCERTAYFAGALFVINALSVGIIEGDDGRDTGAKLLVLGTEADRWLQAVRDAEEADHVNN